MKPYYQDSAVTIYHGDCRDVLADIPPVDCIVTSPPYNQLGSRIPDEPTGLWAKSDGGAQWITELKVNGYADDMDEVEYQKWQNALFACIPTRKSASLFYNHQIRWRDGVVLHPVQWFQPKDWHLRSEIVWDRGGGMMFNARMFCRFDERILWFHKGTHKWNQASVGHGTIWRINKAQNKAHPVAYPAEIPERCIASATDPGDLIIDPFMGSGTTLRAAKDLGRNAIGIEIEERYCEIAARRMAQEVLFSGDAA